MIQYNAIHYHKVIINSTYPEVTPDNFGFSCTWKYFSVVKSLYFFTVQFLGGGFSLN